MAVETSSDTTGPVAAPAPEPTLQNIGRYSLKKGDAAEKFWALDPSRAKDAAGVVPIADVTPTIWGEDFSTLKMPPRFGIFDIVIEISDDYDDLDKKALKRSELLEQYDSVLISGKPKKKEMPLAVDENREARIAFAVLVPEGDENWEGSLTLEANLAAGKKRITLKLKVKKGEVVDDLWIFFIANSATNYPRQAHAWCQVKVVDAVEQPIENVVAEVKVLRNNQVAGYKRINRRATLHSRKTGLLARHDTRTVLGLPIEYPLIFNLHKAGCVYRGHMLKIAAAEVKHNLDPLRAPAERMTIQMLFNEDVDLSGMSLLIDPGHGVVYSDAGHRRCQEWFAASKLGDAIERILTGRFKMPAQAIHWTRTAGFAPIAPGSMADAKAPEAGAARYTIRLQDPADRRISVTPNTPVPADERLKHLAELLFTEISAAGVPQVVAVSDREALLRDNLDTVEAVVSRRLGTHHSRWRIKAGTFAWDADAGACAFEVERKVDAHWQDAGTGSAGWRPDIDNYALSFSIVTPVAGEAAASAARPRLSINQGDDFTLTDAMLRRLEDRSARWSLANEIGGDPGFQASARAAMQAAGAIEYMKAKMRSSNDRPANDDLLMHGTMGWNVNHRKNYFNAMGTSFIFTIHKNGNSDGSQQIGYTGLIAASPPADSRRIARTFLKYMDPFDQGVTQEGVMAHTAGMVASGAYRTKYIYFELEFMDTLLPEGVGFQYEEMLGEAYLSRVAEQAVAGLIEWLLLRQDQATFDAVTW